jgi:SAM-dependent methyltransferase
MANLAIRKSGIIRTISSNDQMFFGNEDHYFGVGQSALDCINISLQATQKPTSDIKRILDLPCGHGRVLRYLKAAFPEAEITACDLMHDGVDFCASTFGAIPVYSHDDPTKIPLERNAFDLIWVGSLFTHFDADLWTKFLRVFCSFLSPGAILVFSTHGYEVYRKMVMDNLNYGIPSHEKATILYDYERDGFGYVRYPGLNSNYGLSLSSPHWVLTQIAKLSELRVVHFSEKAWDNHHDCFSCVRDPDWQQRKHMDGYRNAFMDLITPKGMWTRFEQLCSERSDVQTLFYVLGSRHKALEWIHSVGVCLDAGLGSYVPLLPPRELRELGAAPEPEVFLWTGLVDLTTVLELYERHRITGAHAECTDILDFGCGCGRLLRFFTHAAGSWRAVGSDVDATIAGWCQENLKGTETYVNGVMPPLHHADGSFDLVYSLSVFTHLNEAEATAWLHELGRVLRPGGLLIVTTHGVHTLEIIRNSAMHQQMFGIDRAEVERILGSFGQTHFVFKRYDDSVIKRAQTSVDYGNAFIHPDYAREHWSDEYFEVCDILPAALRGWQDIVVLRRR